MDQNLNIYDNRKFIIFNVDELSIIDFTQIHETSINTMRKSVDKSKTFVKWDGEMPESVMNLITKEGPYTYEEMISILDTPEWSNNSSQII
jgi:hypothetical protein